MADPWYSEIELQKVFSLSPGEAYCQICVRNGLSPQEIGRLTGQSYNTVRTLLRRGTEKMKKSSKTCTFVIMKGNKDVEGTMIKRNAVEVLARFMKKVYKTENFNGVHTCMITGIPTDILGNPTLMNETVFRRADLYGTTNDSEAEARAERLYEAYKELDDGRNMLGVAVLRYLLDKMMVPYDVFE